MTTKKKTYLLFLGAVVAVPLMVLGGCNIGQYEEPAYRASSVEDDLSIREYAPLIAAQVRVEGERQKAISEGFRTIADYIFGNNVPKASIAMTTPVIQQADAKPGKKIAMTTPVTQQSDSDGWVVQFIMPSDYTLDSLPKPNNPAVKLVALPARRMAVIRFSGSSKNEAKIAEKTAELRDYVAEKHLNVSGPPVLAFYDPPWTLPFLRRNEVMLEITPDPQAHNGHRAQ